MDVWLLTCAGCRARLRTSRPDRAIAGRACPRCGAPLSSASIAPFPSADLPGPPAVAARPAPALPAPRWPRIPWFPIILAGLGLAVAWSSSRVVRQARTALPLIATQRPNGPVEPPVLSPRRIEPLFRRLEPSAPIAQQPPRSHPWPVLSAPPTVADREPAAPAPAEPSRAEPAPQPPPAAPRPRHLLIADASGRSLVARPYGGPDSPFALLPDGRIARPDGLVFTDEPFRPATMDQLADDLVATDYPGFHVTRSDHYLVLSSGSPEFARASAELLESLYRGLSDALRARGLPVFEAEFPLVAVIDRTEAEFRARKRVAPEVQAYYEVGSNRIFLHELSSRDARAPEVLARRRPQTVAHEGTHQVLQNIGVQPRLADWPAWLTEGLAEFCAPTTLRNGRHWDGWNRINPFHMATIRELDEAPAASLPAPPGAGRAPAPKRLDALLAQDELDPTDYALAWSVVHYLYNRHPRAFMEYLKELGRLPPADRRTPDQHLADFRRAFHLPTQPMEQRIARHLATVRSYEPIPYYAIVFEQQVGPWSVRRETLISRSPTYIRQWLDALADPDGPPYAWRAWPFETRTQALTALQQWSAP